MPQSQTVLVLHFGGPYAAHVARLIRTEHVFCEVLPCNAALETIRARQPVGLVLAGEDFDRYPCDPGVFSLGVPILRVSSPSDCDALSDFLFARCECRADWNMDMFIRDAVADIERQVGDGRVLLGLSGGVDSAVTAALIHRAIGHRLDCVFVDHGLMRKGEPEEVRQVFTRTFDVHLVAVDASDRFLDKLAGVEDPERKRKIIGAEFIDVFSAEAEKLGRLDYLAQGTIYPDIIESGSAPGEGVIKSHHNVGGLPERIQFKGLVEPLRMLFKDEVRQVGLALGLPESMVRRQPFPGPGLGVRVTGAITREKVHIEREADAIFRQELERAGLAEDISQYFTVLTGARSVGVRDGKRAYDNVVCLRAVHTTDFMTASWARLPYEVVARVSQRIAAEVPHVSRVVLDVTDKPPAAIEWE